MTFETVTNFVEIAFVGVCLFCGNLLLLRRRDQGVYLPLALLFLFQAVAKFSYVIGMLTGAAGQLGIVMYISTLFVVLEISSPLLFWLYVCALTSEGKPDHLSGLRPHLILIIIVSLLIWSLTLMPPGLNEANLEDMTEEASVLVRVLLIGLAVTVAEIMFQVMIGVYLYLTIRRLQRYNKQLREVFASTEHRELGWVWAITIVGGIFWFLNIATSVALWGGVFGLSDTSDLFQCLASVALLALFWVIGIWGLRQRPGLTRDPVAAPEEPDAPPTRKYEKSALDKGRAARIARKINAAMEEDLLYREPNLSLWDLARHIGVTSHYVSQTLNTTLGASFFDYINRWRIQDAVKQLTSTDETILMIAYDVGFNSRSAFYKAFKRETGKTPSDLRK